jgi:hypothetical protein
MAGWIFRIAAKDKLAFVRVSFDTTQRFAKLKVAAFCSC